MSVVLLIIQSSLNSVVSGLLPVRDMRRSRRAAMPPRNGVAHIGSRQGSHCWRKIADRGGQAQGASFLLHTLHTTE